MEEEKEETEQEKKKTIYKETRTTYPIPVLIQFFTKRFFFFLSSFLLARVNDVTSHPTALGSLNLGN